MTAVQNVRQVLTRPLDFFYDIQFNNRTQWSHAIVLVALAVIVKLLSILITGYSFEAREAYQISALAESVYLVLPWLTWCISNWGVSAILDGEGKFKDIFVSSAYTLVPYILLSVPIAVLSNILSQSELNIYNILIYGTYIWCALLLLIQVKVIHDFELGKVFWITMLTIFGIFIIWFIGLLLFGLINQVIGFAIDVVKEIKFRL